MYIVCTATVDFSLSLKIGLLSILEEGTGELDDVDDSIVEEVESLGDFFGVLKVAGQE